MSVRLRVWIPASVLGLFVPAAGFADHCLTKSCAPAPAPKVIVEMSPPEVTFKQAPATCVKCPPKPAAAVSYAPAPQQAVYAPMPVYAPVFAPAPMPMTAPAFAPMAAPVFAPQAAPCGSAGGYSAFPQAAPSCGTGGYSGVGPMSGFGTTASDLRAAANALELHEKAALEAQLAVFERQYSVIYERAKAANLSPSFSPSVGPSGSGTQSSPTTTPKNPGAPPIPAGNGSSNAKLLQDIEALQRDVVQLQKLFLAHQETLEKKGLIPPTPER